MSLSSQLILSALVVLVAPSLAMAAEGPVIPEFPPDADTCYGRVYDKAHLATHPRQKVSELYLFRSLTSDPEDEEMPQSRADMIASNLDWEKTTRAEAPPHAEGAPPGRSELEVLVKFKDKKDLFGTSVDCWPLPGGRFHCGVDCDGGSFEAAADGTALKLHQDMNSSGLRVQAGCNSDDESAPDVRIDPEDDAVDFRLEPMPIASCLAARDASRPEWVTKDSRPLRERFSAKAGLCFVPKGSIAKVTGGRIGALTLTTLDRPEAGGDDARPMLKVEFHATVEGGAEVTKTLDCAGANHAFDCLQGGNGFKLTRSGASGMALRELSYEGAGIADLLGLDDGERFDPIVLEEADGSRCK